MSGPGTVIFGNAAAVATTASFSAAGIYVLRLTADDGGLSSFDDVTITVTAAGSLVSNIRAASGAPYIAVDNGLQAGATAYLDRIYLFVTVPPALQEATYIQTANDDKTSTNSAFLTFTLTEAATVYVGYDSRAATQPSWLASFTNTGLQLTYFDTNPTTLRVSVQASSRWVGTNCQVPRACIRLRWSPAVPSPLAKPMAPSR